MAFPSAWARHSLLFRIANTEELAQTDICTTNPAGTSATQLSAAGMQDLAEAYVTMVSGTGILWANWSQLYGVKSATLGPDGKYLQDASTLTLDPFFNGSTTATVPAQCSIVVSLDSGVTLGDGNRGRMYLPHTMFLNDTGTPRALAANAQALALRGAAFVAAVNALVGAGGSNERVSIISQKRPSAPRAVVRVRVGRVTDTQRRRRAQLDEDYQVAPV